MDWHTITPIAEDVYQIAEPIGAIEPRAGVATVNMYLVIGQKRAAMIDGGMGIGALAAVVAQHTRLPCVLLGTHSHWDHMGANAQFAERAIHAAEADAVAHAPDVASVREAMESDTARSVLPPGTNPAQYRILAAPATHIMQDGDVIDLGGRVLQVLHTPGHSPGHVAYHDAAHGLLFTGDAAYRGPMYACFAGGDAAAFVGSVQRLAHVPGVRLICPGHNGEITTPGWLPQLAEDVAAAASDPTTVPVRTAFATGREHRFDDASLWLPP